MEKEDRFYWLSSDGKTFKEIDWNEWRKKAESKTNYLLMRTHKNEFVGCYNHRFFFCPIDVLQQVVENGKLEEK